MVKKILLPILAGLLACSCSVKESRDGSPCRLYSYVSRMPDSKMTIHQSSSAIMCDTEHKDLIESMISRGTVIVTAITATPNIIIDSVAGSYIYKTGIPADGVYTYRRSVDCGGEYAIDTLVPHKRFASLGITVDIGLAHPLFPDTLVLVSSWCGEQVTTMSPIKGEFECAFPYEGEKLTFRIPRQGDNSLLLLLKRGGRVADTALLGAILDEAGYDWTKEDLEDADIVLYGTDLELKIAVKDWKTDEPIVIDL